MVNKLIIKSITVNADKWSSSLSNLYKYYNKISETKTHQQ